MCFFSSKELISTPRSLSYFPRFSYRRIPYKRFSYCFYLLHLVFQQLKLIFYVVWCRDPISFFSINNQFSPYHMLKCLLFPYCFKVPPLLFKKSPYMQETFLSSLVSLVCVLVYPVAKPHFLN